MSLGELTGWKGIRRGAIPDGYAVQESLAELVRECLSERKKKNKTKTKKPNDPKQLPLRKEKLFLIVWFHFCYFFIVVNYIQYSF